jgi:DNA-binding CsgD family transcriptional regulator
LAVKAQTIIDSKKMAAVVENLGNTHFSEVFLQLLNSIEMVEHFSLVQLGANEARFIASANASSVNIPKSLQKMYLNYYFKKDPNIQLLVKAAKSDSILYSRLEPENIEDSSYQHFFDYDIKIVDRLSFSKGCDKGLYCLNLYRFSNKYSPAEIEKITDASNLLMSCAIKHTRLAGGLSDFLTRDAQINELEQRLHAINSKLSTRELEVCARALLGFSNEGIGLNLGIKLTSIQTYRKRAYAKLNISSQNELFGLCLKN